VDVDFMVSRHDLFHYALGVFFCFAGVDGERFVETDGVLELGAEDFLLDFAG